jgi:phosphoenolpyruvate---glycerone phosphotransferase subunit DhaM
VVGIVVVSHSSSLASGVADLAGQMAGPDVRIEAAGGASDGGLGTDAERVGQAIADADAGDGVVVLCDLGSAILTVRELLEDHAGQVVLADAPVVEGAVAAAVVASAGRDVHEVARAAEEARDARKL